MLSSDEAQLSDETQSQDETQQSEAIQCSFCLYSESHKNPKLCKRCQCWDDLIHMIHCTSSQYNDLGINVDETWGFEAGEGDFPSSIDMSDTEFHSMKDMAEAQNCIVCRTLVEGLRMNNAQDEFSVGLLRLCPGEKFALELSGELESRRGSWTDKFILVFCFAYSQADDKQPTILEPHHLELQLSYSSEHHGLEDIKMWDRRLVNTTNIRDWVSYCQEHHKMCDQSLFHRVLPSGFRVIDVTTRSIVEPSTDTGSFDFVALSYQWATASADRNRDIMLLRNNMKKLQVPGSLLANRLPEVIQDAIQFCRDFGYRYLWVDRLCIYQDEEDEDGLRRAQVDGMDAIYWLAALTLVACADGVGVGLPGVAGRPRLNLKNQGWIFRTDLRFPEVYFDEPSSTDFIDPSSWNARGWTFQERWISRRLIFFGQGHALLNCFYVNECEESVTRKSLSKGKDTAKFYGSSFGTDVRTLDVKSGTIYSLYIKAVEAYTSRSLSLASDALQAFSGVNNFLVEKLQTKSIYGLPENHLFSSLLWLRGGTSSSEDIPVGIPSWSWATRLGAANYLDVQSYDKRGSLVRFWYSENGSVREVVEATYWFDESNTTAQDSPSPEFELRRFQENTEHCNSKYNLPDPGVWETCPHNPLEAISHRQITEESRVLATDIRGCLVFNTTETSLRVRVNENPSPFKRWKGLDLNIISDQGVLIGYNFPEEYPKDHKLNISVGQDLRCHVIVLGATIKSKTQWWTWGLIVMLVDRNGYLSSRLGIGIVNAKYWAEVKPEWNTVFLV